MAYKFVACFPSRGFFCPVVEGLWVPIAFLRSGVVNAPPKTLPELPRSVFQNGSQYAREEDFVRQLLAEYVLPDSIRNCLDNPDLSQKIGFYVFPSCLWELMHLGKVDCLSVFQYSRVLGEADVAASCVKSLPQGQYFVSGEVAIDSYPDLLSSIPKKVLIFQTIQIELSEILDFKPAGSIYLSVLLVLGGSVHSEPWVGRHLSQYGFNIPLRVAIGEIFLRRPPKKVIRECLDRSCLEADVANDILSSFKFRPFSLDQFQAVDIPRLSQDILDMAHVCLKTLCQRLSVYSSYCIQLKIIEGILPKTFYSDGVSVQDSQLRAIVAAQLVSVLKKIEAQIPHSSSISSDIRFMVLFYAGMIRIHEQLPTLLSCEDFEPDCFFARLRTLAAFQLEGIAPLFVSSLYGMSAVTQTLLSLKFAFGEGNIVCRFPHGYFEVSSDLGVFGKLVKLGFIGSVDPQESSCILMDAIWNDAASEDPLVPQKDEILELLKSLKDRKTPVTLILDVTLRSLQDPELAEIVEEAADLISCGTLNLVCCMSLAKHFQPGTDLYNGGLVVALNNRQDPWSTFNDVLGRSSVNLERGQAAYFSKLISSHQHDYICRIRDNTRTLSDRLLLSGMNGSFSFSPDVQARLISEGYIKKYRDQFRLTLKGYSDSEGTELKQIISSGDDRVAVYREIDEMRTCFEALPFSVLRSSDPGICYITINSLVYLAGLHNLPLSERERELFKDAGFLSWFKQNSGAVKYSDSLTECMSLFQKSAEYLSLKGKFDEDIMKSLFMRILFKGPCQPGVKLSALFMDKLSFVCDRLDLPVSIRMSFGFFLTAMSSARHNVRLSVGTEEEGVLSLYSDLITSFRACFLTLSVDDQRGVILGVDSSIQAFDVLLEGLIQRFELGIQQGLLTVEK